MCTIILGKHTFAYNKTKLTAKELTHLEMSISKLPDDELGLYQKMKDMINQKDRKEVACVLYDLYEAYSEVIASSGFQEFCAQPIEKRLSISSRLMIRPISRSIPTLNDMQKSFKEIVDYFYDVTPSEYRLLCTSICTSKAFSYRFFDDPILNSLSLYVSDLQNSRLSQLQELIEWVLFTSLCFAMYAFFVFNPTPEDRRENSYIWTSIILLIFICFACSPFFSYFIYSSGVYSYIYNQDKDFFNTFSALRGSILGIFMPANNVAVTRILNNNTDLLTFFRNNPNAEPFTLWELMHKIFSDHDFYDKIPFSTLENTLKEFVIAHQDALMNKQFPLNEFVAIKIVNLPWFCHTDCEVFSENNLEEQIRQNTAQAVNSMGIFARIESQRQAAPPSQPGSSTRASF